MSSEKNIISASRRTDIPAFFSEWFNKRLMEGFCLVRNPFNSRQISRVSLLPENVEAFVFWTRNPEPFWNTLMALQEKEYDFGFMITITGYPRYLEPQQPDFIAVIDTLERLSKEIGSHKLIWRYDPIIISDLLNFSWHLKNFTEIARIVSPFVRNCIISFADFYRKTEKNLRPLARQNFNPDPQLLPEAAVFLKSLAEIASHYELPLFSCCETDSIFKLAGIQQCGCINQTWLEEITGRNLHLKKHKGQRPECSCLFSKDIGSYDTCLNGCLYCYATETLAKAKSRIHIPDDEKL